MAETAAQDGTLTHGKAVADAEAPATESRAVALLRALNDVDLLSYARRPRRPEPSVGAFHVIASLLGLALGVAMLSVPLMSDMSLLSLDSKAVSRAVASVREMGESERWQRLDAARRRNAAMAGWEDWSGIDDNAGKAGAGGSTATDIAAVGDAAGDEGTGWQDEAADASDPLDVGGGVIGTVTLPNGRAIVMGERSCNGRGLPSLMRRERWSSLPVGGDGTACVLVADTDGPGAWILADEMSSVSRGDALVLGVLGDSYSYSVGDVWHGGEGLLLERARQLGDGDSLAVLFGDGEDWSLIVAGRIRYDGAGGDPGMWNPSLARDLTQAALSWTVGAFAALTFGCLLAAPRIEERLRRRRDERQGRRHERHSTSRRVHSRERSRG